MTAFRDVLTKSIAEALRNRRRNVIDWTATKVLLGSEFRLDPGKMNVSLISHNNFHPRLRQKGFDGELDLAVLVSDIGSTFTDRVCDGLHRQRSEPDWPLLVLQETSSGHFRGERFIMGPSESQALRRRVEASWPGIRVSTYRSVWR